MTTPESPLDKKNLTVDAPLTLEERVGKLESTLENAFNFLAKNLSEVEFRAEQESKELQAQISKTLTLMNMSILQNIITIRETLRVLIEKEVVDAPTFEAQVTAELTKAIEAQQKAMMEAQAPVVEETPELEVAN